MSRQHGGRSVDRSSPRVKAIDPSPMFALTAPHVPGGGVQFPAYFDKSDQIWMSGRLMELWLPPSWHLNGQTIAFDKSMLVPRPKSIFPKQENELDHIINLSLR